MFIRSTPQPVVTRYYALSYVSDRVDTLVCCVKYSGSRKPYPGLCVIFHQLSNPHSHCRTIPVLGKQAVRRKEAAVLLLPPQATEDAERDKASCVATTTILLLARFRRWYWCGEPPGQRVRWYPLQQWSGSASDTRQREFRDGAGLDAYEEVDVAV